MNRFRYYTLATWGFAAIWVVGLVVLLRFRKKRELEASASEDKRTVWDELKLRINKEKVERLTLSEKVEIERLAYIFLCQEQFAGMDTTLAVQQLKQDPDSRALLQRFEQWLHMPVGNSMDLDMALDALERLSSGDKARHAVPPEDIPEGVAQ